MLVSQLLAQLKFGPGDARDFVVYLASVDFYPGDDVDVQTVEVGDVVVDYEKNHIRLVPASSLETKPDEGTFAFLGSVLDSLPTEVDGQYDMRLLIELPLVREDPKFDRIELTEAVEIYFGSESQEAWFLVQPANRFERGSLPV
jgi:hypothetical protein